MKLNDINTQIKAAGFGISTFQYDEKVFGSWFAVIETGNRTWRLIYEGRDAMLILQESSKTGWNDVKYQNIRGLSNDQTLYLAVEWLKETTSLAPSQ